MSFQSTCLHDTNVLPEIPKGNLTPSVSHSSYNPNGRAVTQIVSSALTRIVFSTNDIESLIKKITSGGFQSSDASTIVKTKPFPSIIIYASITLALFLILSLIFCICTCACRRKDTYEKNHRGRKRKCSCKWISILFLILISLLVIGNAAYASYQLNRTRVFLDDSIRVVNREIYPKGVASYLEHLIRQLNKLDQYTTQKDSIVIKASKTIFVNAFKEIFPSSYFLNDILHSLNNTLTHTDQLNSSVYTDPNSNSIIKDLLNQVQKNNKRMIDDLMKPIDEVCTYATNTDTETDEIIADALDVVHQQLRKLIDTVQNEFLSHISSEENATLINKDLEDKIRSYIRLATIILLVLVIVLGAIPVIFILNIFLCRACCCKGSTSSSRKSKNYFQRFSSDSRGSDTHRSSYLTSSNVYKSSPNYESSKCSSNAVICTMRIFFTLMILILIIISLLSGILYLCDLVVHGTCRMVHEDRKFLVNMIIDNVFGSNSTDLIIGGLSVENTILTIFDDCGSQTHFAEKFFRSHLSSLDNHTIDGIDELNHKVFLQFDASIKNINIASQLNTLENLTHITNSAQIQNQTTQIINDLKEIQERFVNISTSMPAIPPNVLQSLTNDLRNYIENMLKFTIDACPLPMGHIFEADILLCHNLASSVNGLWLSLFVYMFFIVFGLCIIGLCVYKRYYYFMKRHDNCNRF